ncbi:hypothetical protein BXT86_01310 [candidate division WOR-3 bacterium 4484_100]|uniref:Zinc finger DksA/TraR C4-type domain-containing protein n=1 Tax=candidate division WOR-3 bacterium 4484_100 TaxID=1936077 RepID=A0A1V4QGQ0_UNCW3|nr:MAG: hypothetical protein BXT86_01310 [candidate division WOR-3 bacterium 4484_100]
MTKRFKKSELKRYEQMLLKEREKILKELQYEGNQITQTQQDASGDLSAYSNHMADMGSETERREITSQILSTRRDMLLQIEYALKKINTGNYGICERCGKPIAKRRLKFMPQARLCIKCSKVLGR